MSTQPSYVSDTVYSSLQHYGMRAPYGTGVIAPSFYAYPFATYRQKTANAIPLCVVDPVKMPIQTPSEFEKMMRQRK